MIAYEPLYMSNKDQFPVKDCNVKCMLVSVKLSKNTLKFATVYSTIQNKIQVKKKKKTKKIIILYHKIYIAF